MEPAMLGVPASKRMGRSFQVALWKVTSWTISPPVRKGSICSRISGLDIKAADTRGSEHLVAGEGEKVAIKVYYVYGQVRERSGRRQ